MRRFYIITLISILLLIPAISGAKPQTSVDAYVEKGFIVSSIKSLYLWPPDIKSVPEQIELSMPNLLEDWREGAMKSKKIKSIIVLRDTDEIWRNVRFIHGESEFAEPFESVQSAQYFYTHLDGACSAVLKMTVSLNNKRTWTDERIETYTTYERAHGKERRKKDGGGYEYVDIWVDVPVERTRVIPGYWTSFISTDCYLELYDTKKLDGKYIAASRVIGEDYGRDNERAMMERLMKRTVEDGIAAIFYEK
jgi:hypothetical protein